jgi:hypothetical protein
LISYFSYGSNMSPKRFCSRVPGAQHIGVFRLARYDLKFHKVGRDGSAKCDAHFTGNDEDYVLGVLWEMSMSSKAALDQIEGLGNGYAEAQVSVHAQDLTRSALTYVATRIDADLKPFSWYVRHVLEGARAAGLPEDYVSALEAVATQRDLDAEREARELGVYS